MKTVVCLLMYAQITTIKKSSCVRGARIAKDGKSRPTDSPLMRDKMFQFRIITCFFYIKG